MAQIRDIKKRMVAVSTIQRITKTVQMMATARFTAAAHRAKASRPYTDTIRRLVRELAQASEDVAHPLIDGPQEPVGRERLLVITSDRGLCGAYNANVLRVMLGHIRGLRKRDVAFDLATSGKKAVGFFKFAGIDVVERHAIGDKPAYDDVEKIAAQFIDEFVRGEYDAVRVAYMRFESASRQVPELLSILPLEPETAAEDSGGDGPSASYELSPSAPELLADLLPLAVKAQLYQAFTDAAVSEQIMRMVGMKAATENAKDLSKTLHRRYNRARQSRITTELSEIIAGSAALE